MKNIDHHTLAQIIQRHTEGQHYPGYTVGFIVDQQLVHCHYAGLTNAESGIRVSEQSLFRIASMSKSFVAMAILKLRDAGMLSLQDRAEVYVPELETLVYPGAHCPPISVWNLLTMTAGFPEDNRWADRQLAMSDESLVQLIRAGLSFSRRPNEQMEYSNLSYAILGLIIRNLSQRPYQDYIEETIFKPLGMHNTHWEFAGLPKDALALGYRLDADQQWQQEPLLHDGAFGAIGGVITTLSDFSRYVQFLLSAWHQDDGAVGDPVCPQTTREMATSQVQWIEAGAGHLRQTSLRYRGYGYGLGVFDDKVGRRYIGHGGALPGFGSGYRYYPEQGVAVIFLSNLSYAPGSAALIDDVSEYLLTHHRGDPCPSEPTYLGALERARQDIMHLLDTWDKSLIDRIFADNMLLDEDLATRQTQAMSLIDDLGSPMEAGPLRYNNWLRGSFMLTGKTSTIEVMVALTPEAIPRIHTLTFTLSDPP